MWDELLWAVPPRRRKWRLRHFFWPVTTAPTSRASGFLLMAARSWDNLAAATVRAVPDMGIANGWVLSLTSIAAWLGLIDLGARLVLKLQIYAQYSVSDQCRNRCYPSISASVVSEFG